LAPFGQVVETSRSGRLDTKEATTMLSTQIRFAQALLVATIVATAVPMIAGAGIRAQSIPDVFERYAAAHPFGFGVANGTSAPDWFERYAASHAPTVLLDGRSPDTLDAADAAQLQIVDGRSPDTVDAAQAQIVDGRSPDTVDAAVNPQPLVLGAVSGFDWGDAGVGAGLATALLSVVSGSTLLLFRRHQRGQMHTA
jgi:hypothetical protein